MTWKPGLSGQYWRIVACRGGPAPDAAVPTVVLEFGRRLRGRVRASNQVRWLGQREHGVILMNRRPKAALAVRRRQLQMLGGVYRLGPDLLSVRLSAVGASHSASGETGLALWAAATARVQRETEPQAARVMPGRAVPVA